MWTPDFQRQTLLPWPSPSQQVPAVFAGQFSQLGHFDSFPLTPPHPTHQHIHQQRQLYLPWKHTQNECFLPTAGADWQHAHMHVRWSPVSVSAPMVCSQHGGQRGPLGPKVITAIPLSNSSKGCSFHTEEPHILNHLLQRCLSPDPVHLLAGLAAAAFNMSSSACSPLQAFTDHCCLGWNTLLGDSLTVHSLTSPSRLHWNINVTSEAFSNHNIK